MLRVTSFATIVSIVFPTTATAAANLGPSQTAAAAELIHWKSVDASRAAPAAADPAATLAVGPARHVVVQFDQIPTTAQQAALEAAGLKLLRYLGSRAFFARTSGAGPVLDAAIAARVTAAFEIETDWKLHPALLAGEYPSYARFAAPAPAPADAGAQPVDTLALYVVFHADVDPGAEGAAAVARHGGTLRDTLESITAAVVWLPLESLRALAAEDAVQWIEPPLPPLSEVNDSNRAITQVDAVQAPPYGLDGSGVNVLVYDGGYARASHVDFGGRLTVRDNSGLSDHATHVSGTVGGSGAGSGGTFRGMAPAVIMQSYGFDYDGTGIFLYTNPGDLEHDYNEAINTHGAVISNNSIGTNTALNGFPCAIEGDYGVTDMLIDAIVRGSLGQPMRIVWANGNERGYGRCGSLYHTTAPPACAKNHITVGALNSNDDSMTSFSSWGPCDDGRLKPDVSAPGCQVGGDGGVTSASSSGGYNVKCGTSMASPTVCGIGALILQDFQAQFPGVPLPRNSTLKVLLAHNAADLGNTGPDYKFGYGSVRAADTIDFLRTGSFREDTIAHGEEKLYFVYVPPGTPALKATLAWDDPPGAVNTIPELVNDLDVEAVSPADGGIHYPWTLNPADGNAPAVRTGPDRANNIEQVVVGAPASGTWTIRVRGFAVPEGPQVFSLAATPDMRVCSSAGVVLLNANAYACESAAAVTVIDCDLNTNAEAIETVTVAVTSTSDPDGESVLLTETTPSSAVFTGSLPLSQINTNGTLHVAPGDSVTATYNDADDGSGVPAVREDDATVDCVGPVIANVVAEIDGLTMTVTFETDEPACGVVRFGTSCAALSDSAAGVCGRTSHVFTVSLALPDTTYFLAVDAQDGQGNSSTDDNGGNCYTVTTANLIFVDPFASTTLDSANWTSTLGSPTVDDVGLNEPSPPYSLRLRGGGGVESRTINLSALCGIQLRYYFERAGGGSSPNPGDDLIVEYLSNSGSWVEFDRQFGAPGSMTLFQEQIVRLPAAAYHSTFRFRIRSLELGGDFDDWFIDDVLLEPPLDADCNSNAVPDECDIETGTSADCQADGTPDECQVAVDDCDTNGVPDSCLAPWYGAVLALDGANDYVRITSAPELRPANNFTIEAWVNVRRLGPTMTILMHDENGGGDDGYALRVSPGGFAEFLALNQNGATAQSVTSDRVVEVGRWHHLAGVYDNSVLRVYLDGHEMVKPASGNVVYALLTNVNIGRRGGTSSPGTTVFDGLIADVRFWNVVRTADQIRENMHWRLKENEPGLVAYWRLDEGAGLAAADSAGNHDGSLINGPQWRFVVGDCNLNGAPDACDLAGGTSGDCNFDDIPDECTASGVPAAILIGASSRRHHGAVIGEDDIVINLYGRVDDGNVTSEPRIGGITELRLAFDQTPGLPAGDPLTILEQQCPGGTQEDYEPYTGSSSVFALIEGNELVLTFSPGLANGYTYRVVLTPEVSTVPCQAIEVRCLVGDADSSGRVNATDRSVVVSVWTGPRYSPNTDVSLDGTTNGADRSLVVAAWTGADNCAP